MPESPTSTGSPARRRVAVVLSHANQYYSPWFRWLAAEGSVELRVFYLWDAGMTSRPDRDFGHEVAWDTDITSGYEWEVVRNRARQPGTHHWRGLDNPELPTRLAAWSPDAILLFGYRYLTHLRLLPWARKKGIPVVFRGDSHLLGQPEPGWAKRFVLRRVYSRCAAVTYVGAANREYFSAFGVPDERLFFAPHAVDAAHFDATRPGLPEEAAAWRAELGLAADDQLVLFAGKFVARKQPMELVQAFTARARPGAMLVLQGGGELEEELRSEIAHFRASHRIRILPFANQRAMPGRLLAANLCVLPSRGIYETWGLIVNEAMHMGTPCLVSDLVGSQRDLVLHGSTGWVFPADNPARFTTVLSDALAELRADTRRWREAVRARVPSYSFAAAAAGLHAALDHACARSR